MKMYLILISALAILMGCDKDNTEVSAPNEVVPTDTTSTEPATTDTTTTNDEVKATAIVIDAATTYQTIVDFGASDCWTAEYVADYFSEAQKNRAAEWLFSQEISQSGKPAGIGLSCWRVNIGAGSATQGSNSNIDDETRRAECFLSEDGTYDWSRCDGQQWFMQKAKEYGVPHFLLFSNSAPIYYTKNGLANMNRSGQKCNLKDDCYDDFAEFLATVTEHFANDGYNVTYIDPVNEPQFDWNDGQEGSPWENENVANLVRELNASVEKRGLSSQIIIPEAAKLTCLYAGNEARGNNQIDAFWNRANTNTYIGDLEHVAPIVAGHSYWTFTTNNDLTTIRETVRDAAAEYGLNAMQTEWSMLDKEPSATAGFPISYDAATKMDIALYMGKIIHCDLAYGNMAGWSYWTAFAQEKWSQKNRFYLIRMNAAGDSGDESYGVIKKGGTLTADKNLWVLGNYSRFVRPGSKRIDLNGANELNGLLGSAYISSDNSQIVAVYVNMNNIDITTEATFKNADAPKSMSVFVTDANNNLHRTIQGSYNAQITFGARSVTTVVYDL
ncbi:MAG: glycosyl hydrolase [Marinilabiliaceae bacterium]|nr:glycosyl hydrolase [Marinilabiliaceae bacterium]